MYTIIKEQSGDKIEYTVADMRTGKTIGVYATIEEARIAKEKANNELYKGSGVMGNEM